MSLAPFLRVSVVLNDRKQFDWMMNFSGFYTIVLSVHSYEGPNGACWVCETGFRVIKVLV